jgi:hypothetical protein
MWDDMDFWSDDPLVRFNAHQAAKGRPGLPDPDVVRKAQRESGPLVDVDPGDEQDADG